MDNEKVKEMLMAYKATTTTTSNDRLTVELLYYLVGLKPDMSVQDAYTLIRDVIKD